MANMDAGHVMRNQTVVYVRSTMVSYESRIVSTAPSITMSDMSPIIPTNPLDLPTTQRLLAERIERGEITQADVDLLKKGYRGMAMTTFLGGLVGIPVYIALGRRRPPPGLAVRLAAAGFMTSTGSFLGFTIGGAAAAMEVNTHMADSQRCATHSLPLSPRPLTPLPLESSRYSRKS